MIKTNKCRECKNLARASEIVAKRHNKKRTGRKALPFNLLAQELTRISKEDAK